MSSKKIVITGAGRGLGCALARRFAKDGDTIILLGRTFTKLQAVAAEIGEKTLAIVCDVGSPDSVRDAFSEIAETHPKIDVLINNAAIYEPYFIENASDQQIVDTLMINTAGPIFCVKAALPMMERGAQIINLTSESVDLNFPMMTMYQTSKAGLERFSKSMTEELRPSGIRVTFVRAGAMMDEQKVFDIDPEIGRQFHEAMIKAGINPRERGVTHFNSVTHIFRALVDLPPDLEMQSVMIGARTP